MVTSTIPQPAITEIPVGLVDTGPINLDQIYTLDELLTISQRDENRYELIRGKLIIMPPAGAPRGDYAMSLGARMRIFAEDNDLGKVFAAETGFVLEREPDMVRAPDVAFVKTERIGVQGLPFGFYPGQPDLAVEIVSPNDRAGDVQDKIQDWLTHGTLLVWVVEPKTQTVTVYRPDGSAQVLLSEDKLSGEDVMPGFEFDIAHLFR